MQYKSQLFDLIERLSVNPKMEEAKIQKLFHMIDTWEQNQWSYADVTKALEGDE